METARLEKMGWRLVPRNGILAAGGLSLVIVSETTLDRRMRQVVHGNLPRTYALPRTALAVCQEAFLGSVTLAGLRLNDGLVLLGQHCFFGTGVRGLTLPASVREVAEGAFAECGRLKYADLSAARGLRALGKAAFDQCRELGRLLLNEGLETVRTEACSCLAVEEVVFPRTLRHIESTAFAGCRGLRRVRFAGDALESIGSFAFLRSGLEAFVAPASLHKVGECAFAGCAALRRADLGPCMRDRRSNARVFLCKGAFRESGVEEVLLPRALGTICEETFCACRALRSVVFVDGSALEEVQRMAFHGSGLRSFAVPRSLRRIGDMAFGDCRALRELRLEPGVQLGWFCFWRTALPAAMLPTHTPERLGLQADPRVLALPDGLAEVGENWFAGCEIETLAVSSSVRTLKWCAFADCKRLREVVFEPESGLQRIENGCFRYCALRRLVLPKSVQSIGDFAFDGCRALSALSFEDGSQLKSVGERAFHDTQLRPETVRYPRTLRASRHGKEW